MKTSTKENNNLVEGSSQKATKYRKLITEVNQKIKLKEISLHDERVINNKSTIN